MGAPTNYKYIFLIYIKDRKKYYYNISFRFLAQSNWKPNEMDSSSIQNNRSSNFYYQSYL